MSDHSDIPEDVAAEKQGKDELPRSIPTDVPEADALEQSRRWDGPADDTKPEIPLDVNEADAVEQSQDATGGDELEER